MKITSKVIKAWYEKEFMGEHHMGAYTVKFKLDRKFRGVDTFLTTNGEAMFDEKKPYLIIYDAVVILVFDYEKKELYNIETKKPYLFRKAEINNGKVIYTTENYQTSTTETVAIDLDTHKLSPGYGRINNGKFPSAV